MEQFKLLSSVLGKQIAVKEWKQEDRQTYKAVIQLVHGMQEHILRYQAFAEFLANQGYIVIGHDHLGHGDTVQEKEEFGFFAEKEGWNRLVEDIHLVHQEIENRYPNQSYYIMGHSMGSLLVRTYLTKYTDCLQGAIISGTSGQQTGMIAGIALIKGIKLIKGKNYRSKLVEHLITGSFNNKFKPVKTKADWISRDEEAVEKYLKDSSCGINFTLQAYEDLLKGTFYLSKQKNINKTQKVPILIFSGDKDPVGQNAKGVIRVYKKLQKAGIKDISIRLFPEGRHEMLNEINKQQVYDFILDWIQKRENEVKG